MDDETKTNDLEGFEGEHKNVFIQYVDGTRFIADLVEKSPAYLKVVKLVDEEANKTVESFGQTRKMGACHLFWSSKKEILKKKYGIDWRSPAELNDIMFD
jgi:hypothetical protein